MVKMVRKKMAILFFLFFLSGILILVFVLLVLLSNVPEMSDPVVMQLLSFPLIFLGLAIVYYVVNYVSPEKGMVSLLTIVLGMAFGWIFAGFAAIALEALLGTPRNSLYVPLLFVGTAMGIAIAYQVAKRIYKKESGNLDSG
jgi:hypothetical protein